jgi:hypothetical protein
MAATKKSEALESAGIKKPSQEQQRNPDSERASQEKREELGTKKLKDNSMHETSLDHPQHSYSKYERSHTSAKTEREE